MPRKYLQTVCDYAPGDLAFAEIRQALWRVLPEGVSQHFVEVRPFQTIELGFVVGQLALTREDLRPEELMIFGNCAPRKDRGEARRNNEGEGLLYGLLENGVQLLVVNSGYSLSFVRESLKELWSVHVERGGSQFRSRDFFPKTVGQLASGDMAFKKDRLDPQEVIPEVPAGRVGYVDSFGNIKTTYRSDDPLFADVREGTEVEIRVGQKTVAGYYSTGSFNVPEGNIALAPGSSGHDNRFIEIFERGGAVSKRFGVPSCGEKVSLTFK